MGVFYFPRDFVFWTKVKNHENIKKELVNLIDQHKGHEYETLKNGVTSYDREITDDEEDNLILQNHEFLKEIVWNPINEMIDTVTPKMNFDSAYIAKAWYSKYESGGYVKYHGHEGCPKIVDGEVFYATLSLIYVLHDENEKNQTVFTSHVNSVSKDRIFHFETKTEPEITEGSVILFPSSLLHKVDTINKPGRIIISMNIDSSFTNT
jgi:ectoine hydroxylase-related dioxygenase (phytanoyl-CoA dioxygenase family)